MRDSGCLTSGVEMKEMARPLVPKRPARPTLCKYWSLCSTFQDELLQLFGRVWIVGEEGNEAIRRRAWHGMT